MNITTRCRHDRLGARPFPAIVIEVLVVVMLGAAACTQRSAEGPEGSRTQITGPSLEGVGASPAEQAMVPTPSLRGQYLVDIRTGEVTLLPVGDRLAWPDVSADGRLIAWAGGFVTNVDGSDLHRVGAMGTRPDWGPVGPIGTRPDWSPDGTKLAVDTSTLGVDGSIYVIYLGSGPYAVSDTYAVSERRATLHMLRTGLLTGRRSCT